MGRSLHGWLWVLTTLDTLMCFQSASESPALGKAAFRAHQCLLLLAGTLICGGLVVGTGGRAHLWGAGGGKKALEMLSCQPPSDGSVIRERGRLPVS